MTEKIVTDVLVVGEVCAHISAQLAAHGIIIHTMKELNIEECGGGPRA
jgi:hypothetical protein